MRSGGKRLAQTSVVVACSVGVMAGAAAWRWHAIWSVIMVLALLLLAWRRGAGLVLATFLLFGTAVGWARAQQLGLSISNASQYFGQKVTISGQASDDPAYAAGGQLEVCLVKVRIYVPSTADNSAATNEPSQSAVVSLPGRVRLRGYALSITRGDKLEATGTLRDGFASYTGSMYYASINISERSSGWASFFRRKFQAGIYNALPDPQASFAFGLLVGARSGLPETLNDQLVVVGLMHLVAVSGYNLTIIVRASRKAASNSSPMVGFSMAAGLMICFLLITGFSASIVRAAIVSGLSLLAAYFGRTVKPMPLLTLSAAITILMNPSYIWGDLGWYLSFLAFFGILGLAPAIHAKFKTERLWRQILTETMSAIITTTPLIMFSFGRISMIAPISNIVVLPTIPLAMLLSFVSGLAGMIKPEFAWFFAWPAKLLLGWSIKFIERVSTVSWAQYDLALNLTGMLVCYGLIFGISVVLQSKLRARSAKITDTD